MTQTAPARPTRKVVDQLVISDAGQLRAHLDQLNTTVDYYTAAGIDSTGAAFLITLVGPYAQTEAVIFGSPWDAEVDYTAGTHCDECGAAELFTITDLSFPVVVLNQLEVLLCAHGACIEPATGQRHCQQHATPTPGAQRTT